MTWIRFIPIILSLSLIGCLKKKEEETSSSGSSDKKKDKSDEKEETKKSPLSGKWRFTHAEGLKVTEMTYSKISSLPSLPGECTSGEYGSDDFVAGYMVFHDDSEVSQYFVTSACTKSIKNKSYTYNKDSDAFKIGSGNKMKLTPVGDNGLKLIPSPFNGRWVFKFLDDVLMLDGDPYFFRYEKFDTMVDPEKLVNCAFAGFDMWTADLYIAYDFHVDDTYYEYYLYHDYTSGFYCMELGSTVGQTFKYNDNGSDLDDAWFYYDDGNFQSETHFEIRFGQGNDLLYFKGI